MKVTAGRPFGGARVLDFIQVLGGPCAGFRLALLGADGTKIGRRRGEDGAPRPW